MKCPNCTSDLKEMYEKGLHFWQCVGMCKGIFIFRKEFLSRIKPSGKSLFKFKSYFTPIVCPYCENRPMDKYIYTEDFYGDVTVPEKGQFCIMDECSKCDGLWIDSGDKWFIENYGSDIINAVISGEQLPPYGESGVWEIRKLR